MKPQVQAVLAYLDEHQDALIASLQQMVRTQSVNVTFDPTSPGEAEMAKLVKSRYDALGIPVQAFEGAPGRPNLVATVKGAGGGPRLLVNCHLDTVPADTGEWVDPFTGKVAREWKRAAFGGEIAGGLMYGRGTVDHKMPIAAIQMALEALQASGVRLKGDVVCIHDVDEETGGKLGMQYLAGVMPLDFDMALYACTSDMTPLGQTFFSKVKENNVIRSFSGWHTYRIRFKGVNYHNLTPVRGYGATEAALLFFKRLEPLMARVNAYVCPIEGTGQPAMKISGMEGAPRKAAHHQGLWADLTINRRIPPSVSMDEAMAEMKALIAAHNAEYPENQAELFLDREIKVALTPADHPVVTGLARAVEQVTGQAANVCGLPAPVGISSILGRFPMPTVLFGYGVLNLHHAKDEHIPLADVVKTAKVYAVALMEWLGVAAEA